MYSDRNQIQFCQNHVAKREFHFMGWSFLTREVLFEKFHLQQNQIFKGNSSEILSKTQFSFESGRTIDRNSNATLGHLTP